MEAVLGPALVTLNSASRALGWGLGVLPSAETWGFYFTERRVGGLGWPCSSTWR